jgi:hypothetical protein
MPSLGWAIEFGTAFSIRVYHNDWPLSLCRVLGKLSTSHADICLFTEMSIMYSHLGEIL